MKTLFLILAVALGAVAVRAVITSGEPVPYSLRAGNVDGASGSGVWIQGEFYDLAGNQYPAAAAILTNGQGAANFTGAVTVSNNAVTGFELSANTNTYAQMKVKNYSSGNDASSDFTAEADNGTETSYYLNLGINGSGYVPTLTRYAGGTNDAYINVVGNPTNKAGNGGNFYITTAQSNTVIGIYAGSTNATLTVSNGALRVIGTISGNGDGLTNLNAANIVGSGLMNTNLKEFRLIPVSPSAAAPVATYGGGGNYWSSALTTASPVYFNFLDYDTKRTNYILKVFVRSPVPNTNQFRLVMDVMGPTNCAQAVVHLLPFLTNTIATNYTLIFSNSANFPTVPNVQFMSPTIQCTSGNGSYPVGAATFQMY